MTAIDKIRQWLGGAIFGTPRGGTTFTPATTAQGPAPTPTVSAPFYAQPISTPVAQAPASTPTASAPFRAQPISTPVALAPVHFQPSMVTGGGTPIQSTHLVNAPKAASNASAAANAGYTQLNLTPVSQGGGAGPNAAAVLAAEIPAGHLSLAQQLGGGNPGLPQVGSLEYQDLVNRGLIQQGQ